MKIIIKGEKGFLDRTVFNLGFNRDIKRASKFNSIQHFKRFDLKVGLSFIYDYEILEIDEEYNVVREIDIAEEERKEDELKKNIQKKKKRNASKKTKNNKAKKN